MYKRMYALLNYNVYVHTNCVKICTHKKLRKDLHF